MTADAPKRRGPGRPPGVKNGQGKKLRHKGSPGVFQFTPSNGRGPARGLANDISPELFARGAPPPAAPMISNVQHYAFEFSREAIDGIVALARNTRVNPAVKLAAWREILDRGVGRPNQAVAITDNGEGKLLLMHLRAVVMNGALDEPQPLLAAPTADPKEPT